MLHGDPNDPNKENLHKSRDLVLTSLVVSSQKIQNLWLYIILLQNLFNHCYFNFQSGAAAGTVCDIVFFPLDTLRTRLQSQHGFIKSGGFSKLYNGILPVIVGSAPGGALFFLSYEGVKHIAQPYVPKHFHSIVYMGAACCGEMVACLIRVPVEVMKQRQQALLQDKERLKLRTLFRGYGSTVLRDMPFGLIQMPLWEQFKLYWRRRVNRECTPFEGAVCGSASVAVSAAVTTPLDVAKTRIMLSDTSASTKEVRISTMLKQVYKESGSRGYKKI